MYRIVALLLLLLPLQSDAQGTWGWARVEPNISYNINPSYPRQVIAAHNGNLFWGVLQNKKLTQGQVALGDYLIQQFNYSGASIATGWIQGKMSFIQAAADSDGYWYVLGTFYDTVNAWQGFQLVRGPMESEYFLMRMKRDTLLPEWLQMVGGSYYCSTPSIAIGKHGIYLAIDSGGETKICRYGFLNGERTDLWSQHGSTYTAYLDVDAAENVFLTGTCLTGNKIDFNGTLGFADSLKSYQWYVARYHSNGRHHWHYWLGDISCVPRSFHSNGVQDVVLSGTLWDSTWLGPHYFWKPPRLFNSDFMLAKLDSNGYLRWAEQRPITSSNQGNINFSSVFHMAHADTSHYMFCETSGASIWGNGVGLQTKSNRTQATLVGFGYHGLPSWGRLIEGTYTTAQQIVTDGYDLWVTGVGMDSTAIRFDSIQMPVTPNVYVPYVARLNVRNRPSTTGIAIKVPPICRVFPNPAQDRVSLYGTRNTSIRIHDITGRIVWKSVLPEDGTAQITTAAWPRGIYIVDMQRGSAREVSRLILD
jgi:hypothetical protein